jgi:ribosomal protein S27AE
LDAHKTLKKAIEDLQWQLNEPETWPQVRIECSATGLPLARADTTWGWVDPITPMALQLLEAALRLGEGRRLARTCPACGEVFLALDERRELYCNTRHRDRYLQRAHRARAATTT